MENELRIPHYVRKALTRLKPGAALVRQSSSTDEAISKGDGHLYFTHPDGRPFPTRSAVFCIKNGLVLPINDGLFEGDSQTYVAQAAE